MLEKRKYINNQNKMQMIAGHSNTMEALYGAIKNKFDIIELDIQLTKDNEVIIHDDIFIQNKLIRQMKLNEIQLLDSDIVTLQHLFENIDIANLNIYLNIKGNDFICVYVHRILQKINRNENILIGSFNLKLLEKLYEMDATYNLGVITENVLPDNILQYYIDVLNIAFVSFHWTALNHLSINFLHQKKVLVFTYTCKNDIIKNFTNEYYIDGIISDYNFRQKSLK